jgi:methylphosphotriester-DNA--protein-cysteine methyltransferase
MAQIMSHTAPILSTLPREIRDEIWYLCIASESEELYNDKRRMSLCSSNCKEARSCFPYEFFGPVCSSLGLGPAEYYAIRRMNLIFTCKQTLAEAASIYRRILTFGFRSTQCLEVFSSILGRERSQLCVSKLAVREEIRPCLRGNEARLTGWRASIREKVVSLGDVYYKDADKDVKWITTAGQVAEDVYTDRYWFQMKLSKQSQL